MPHETKATVEEKVRIIELYLSEKIGRNEASKIAGVADETIARWASLYKSQGPLGLVPSARNRIYSKETKLSTVLDYLAGRGTMQEICETYGLKDKRQLGNWLKVYNRHEDFTIQTGGSRMTKGRETTPEERIEIVKACIASGNDYGGMALKYQISYQQVYTWTKKYSEMGEPGLEDRRGHRVGTLPSRTPEEELRDQIARLEKKNYDLEMENALLKKVKELERRRR